MLHTTISICIVFHRESLANKYRTIFIVSNVLQVMVVGIVVDPSAAGHSPLVGFGAHLRGWKPTCLDRGQE